jgi:hypothetical protein
LIGLKRGSILILVDEVGIAGVEEGVDEMVKAVGESSR